MHTLLVTQKKKEIKGLKGEKINNYLDNLKISMSC